MTKLPAATGPKWRICRLLTNPSWLRIQRGTRVRKRCCHQLYHFLRCIELQRGQPDFIGCSDPCAVCRETAIGASTFYAGRSVHRSRRPVARPSSKRALADSPIEPLTVAPTSPIECPLKHRAALSLCSPTAQIYGPVARAYIQPSEPLRRPSANRESRRRHLLSCPTYWVVLHYPKLQISAPAHTTIELARYKNCFVLAMADGRPRQSSARGFVRNIVGAGKA